MVSSVPAYDTFSVDPALQAGYLIDRSPRDKDASLTSPIPIFSHRSGLARTRPQAEIQHTSGSDHTSGPHCRSSLARGSSCHRHASMWPLPSHIPLPPPPVSPARLPIADNIHFSTSSLFHAHLASPTHLPLKKAGLLCCRLLGLARDRHRARRPAVCRCPGPQRLPLDRGTLRQLTARRFASLRHKATRSFTFAPFHSTHQDLLFFVFVSYMSGQLSTGRAFTQLGKFTRVTLALERATSQPIPPHFSRTGHDIGAILPTLCLLQSVSFIVGLWTRTK